MADSGGRFDLSNPFPWIAFLAKQRVFHFTGRRRWWRERGRDCQQDADDPTSSSSATKRREISLLPIQRIRALPARVTSRRGLQLPFFELLRKRGRERERFPLSFGVEYHLSRFLAFHYHLFSFLAGAAFENTIEEDVVSSCPCPAHEKKVAISNTVTRRYSRFVSIFYFLFPD